MNAEDADQFKISVHPRLKVFIARCSYNPKQLLELVRSLAKKLTGNSLIYNSSLCRYIDGTISKQNQAAEFN